MEKRNRASASKTESKSKTGKPRKSPSDDPTATLMIQQIRMMQSLKVRGLKDVSAFDYLQATMEVATKYRETIADWEAQQKTVKKKSTAAIVTEEGSLTPEQAAAQLNCSVKTVKNKLAMKSLVKGANGLITQRSVDHARTHRYEKNFDNLNVIVSAAKKRFQHTFETAEEPITFFDILYGGDVPAVKKASETFLEEQVGMLGKGYREILQGRYRERDKAAGVKAERPPQKERFRRSKLVNSAVAFANAELVCTAKCLTLYRERKSEGVEISEQRLAYYRYHLDVAFEKLHEAFSTFKNDLQQLMDEGIISFIEYEAVHATREF